MKITAIIDGSQFELFAEGYKKNEFYTEKEFKDSLLKQLKHYWESYNTACKMLSDIFVFITDNTPNVTEKKAEILKSENYVRNAFIIKLMEYLLHIEPNWMEGVSCLDFNQSSGVLDIWKYDNEGKLIDENPYTIENW